MLAHILSLHLVFLLSLFSGLCGLFFLSSHTGPIFLFIAMSFEGIASTIFCL